MVYKNCHGRFMFEFFRYLTFSGEALKEVFKDTIIGLIILKGGFR
jgi:hypothetical protein